MKNGEIVFEKIRIFRLREYPRSSSALPGGIFVRTFGSACLSSIMIAGLPGGAALLPGKNGVSAQHRRRGIPYRPYSSARSAKNSSAKSGKKLQKVARSGNLEVAKSAKKWQKVVRSGQMARRSRELWTHV